MEILIIFAVILAIVSIALPFVVISISNTARRIEYQLKLLVHLADAAENRLRKATVETSLLNAVASSIPGEYRMRVVD